MFDKENKDKVLDETCCGEEGCCCNEEDSEEEMVITLEMENENGEVEEIECDIIGVYDAEYDGVSKDYIALSPRAQRESEEYDVWIFKYVENEVKEDEEATFDIVEIDDDVEYENAVSAFDQVMKELDK